MAAGVNYAPNPSFEDGTTTGWSGTIAVTTAPAPGAGQYAAAASTNVTATVPGLTVGQWYTASLYCLPTASHRPQLTVDAAVGISVPADPTVAGRWTRTRITFLATATTHTITVVRGFNADLPIDRLQVVDGMAAAPYFDGTMAPLAVWSGTANNSPSVCAAFAAGLPTTETPILLGAGLCLHTLGWNVATKTGRWSAPAKRGSNPSLPSRSGVLFAANRPYDAGTYALQMWALGSDQDGTPRQLEADALRLLDLNISRIMQAATKAHEPVTLYAWQADGTVRTAACDVAGSSDLELTMGGARAEFSLVFDVLDGSWSDLLPMTFSVSAAAAFAAGAPARQLPRLAAGTAPIEDATFTLAGPAAAGARITSAPNVWVQLNDSLASGDVWAVDSGSWSSTKNGVANQQNITHSPSHPRLVVIPAGELLAAPTVAPTATGVTGGTTTFSLTARRRHWGA